MVELIKYLSPFSVGGRRGGWRNYSLPGWRASDCSSTRERRRALSSVYTTSFSVIIRIIVTTAKYYDYNGGKLEIRPLRLAFQVSFFGKSCRCTFCDVYYFKFNIRRGARYRENFYAVKIFHSCTYPETYFPERIYIYMAKLRMITENRFCGLRRNKKLIFGGRGKKKERNRDKKSGKKTRSRDQKSCSRRAISVIRSN